MRQRELADRYVQALCTIDREGLTLEALSGELSVFSQLYRQSAELRAVMENPGFSSEERTRVLEQLQKKLKWSRISKNFINLLIDKHRTKLLPEIASRLEHRTDAEAGVVRAELTTAIPLDKKRLSRLAQALSRIRGTRVKVETRVDPALIGGAVVRMDGRIYDGSVRRRLATIRQLFLKENR
ncbi:MAG: ATP synthase F1 subunit delta [Bradymonadales bacterium]|nr:ATP synthase F1 subunit delta [Bradymonadales bacterium]